MGIPIPFLGSSDNAEKDAETTLPQDEPAQQQPQQQVEAVAAAASTPHRSVLPLSMQFMRAVGGCGGCCCGGSKNCGAVVPEDIDHSVVLGNFCGLTRPPGVTPLVLQPMAVQKDASVLQQQQPVLERILADYKTACQFYNCVPNGSVLISLRFSLPSLHVATEFHEADLLALAEILLKYGNGPLQYIRRLDFSKRKFRGNHGFGSHGALTLAKVLQETKHVREVFLNLNPIGSYGAAAIFMAVAQNPSIASLRMRRCRISEGGAMAFAHYCVPLASLCDADLSANHMGYNGCIAIDEALKKRNAGHLAGKQQSMPALTLDLEGNLVFQEIMNGVTHGFGVLLAFLGAWIMSNEVEHKSQRHVVSCAVYSTSLVVLYTSSTLYHSFFSMRHTKWVFEVLDKCAIYILIAGSYTPFLQIVLAHEPMWSTYLLSFLWILCGLGIGVEFGMPAWRYRSTFSLAMYLGMGWSTLICLPEVARILPQSAIKLMFMGGVAYTAGVPFFVRDNNLDHAIWHVFVMAGSILHWFGIYLYVTPREIS